MNRGRSHIVAEPDRPKIIQLLKTFKSFESEQLVFKMLENVFYLSNESLDCSRDDVDVGSNLFEHYSPLKVLEDQAREGSIRRVSAAITKSHFQSFKLQIC